MAISDSQKLDYLYKKIGYGVASTDASQYKSPSNEQYPSPLLVRGDNIWVNSGDIPFVPPITKTSIIDVYTGLSATKTKSDLTVRTNRAWLTGKSNWIGVEFGPQYQLKVYVDDPGAVNPSVTGTRLYPDGSGNNDSWFFDYQSGILEFSDTNVPSALTAGKVIFVEGYVYIGGLGLPATVANAALLDSALQQIQSITTGAPSTLDTLQELANAIGNDPHFITTISNELQNEVNRATNAEANISATITSLSANLSNVETSLSTTIISAQAELQTNLTALTSSLAKVAFTGSYTDLVNVPTTVSTFINDAEYANITYVNTAINNAITNLVDGAPNLLNTLNELASAIGNDPAFLTDLTANLSLKSNIADLSTVATSGSYADLTNKPVQTFTFTMSSVWTVVHNRGTKYFVESVFNEAGHKMIVPVQIIDENSFNINLTAATAGWVTVFFG
jgi:hypothetical protein